MASCDQTCVRMHVRIVGKNNKHMKPYMVGRSPYNVSIFFIHARLRDCLRLKILIDIIITL